MMMMMIMMMMMMMMMIDDDDDYYYYDDKARTTLEETQFSQYDSSYCTTIWYDKDVLLNKHKEITDTFIVFHSQYECVLVINSMIDR